VAQPAYGTLSLNTSGSFSYTPAASFTGVDYFTYRVSDGTEWSPSATVLITVSAPNVAPPVVVTPTVLSKPTVKRVGRRGARRTYRISGSVTLGSVSASVPALSSTAAAEPVVLTIQVERYVKRRWRVYKKVRVVNPDSRYTIRTKLRSGRYRARTLASGGGVPAARSAATKPFRVH
jgi:hypothetical protein